MFAPRSRVVGRRSVLCRASFLPSESLESLPVHSASARSSSRAARLRVGFWSGIARWEFRGREGNNCPRPGWFYASVTGWNRAGARALCLFSSAGVIDPAHGPGIASAGLDEASRQQRIPHESRLRPRPGISSRKLVRATASAFLGGVLCGRLTGPTHWTISS